MKRSEQSAPRAVPDGIDPTPSPDGEPEAEQGSRLDREHEELFHELRSIIPGAEVLFAFLLTIAFTARFQELTDSQRAVYFGTFGCASGALILLLAPTAFHRVRFRQRDKERMVRLANIEMIVAMVLISVSIVGTSYLISSLVFDERWAFSISAAGFVVISLLWWAVPLARRNNT